jgi:acetylornithine deacetylase/succinyl-diaminopimelate desuccinylase-like protein
MKRFVLLVLALLVATSASAADWDAIGREATSMLQEYVRIDTSNPPGNEIAAARFLAERFEAERIEVQIFESEPGRASIIARLPGDGSARPVVLLNHLDTVGADPEEWSHPPRGGVIDDDYLYGRGALDCKGMGVVQAMAMIAIARSGEKLPRDLIFLGTADEETGGRLGAGWFVANRLGLLRDAEFVLNEGGEGRRFEDGSVVYEVGVVEKTPFWLRLTARGAPGHGSTPRGMSAVERLVRALEKVRTRPREIRVVPEVATHYQALAARQTPELRARYENLAAALEDEDFRAEFLSRPEDAALVQSTISMTVLQGSDKTNVVPARASAELDCRLLPDETPQEFLPKLRSIIDDDEIEIEVLLDLPPSSSPIDTALYRAIESVAAREKASVVPNVLRGFTDSHYFRAQGITVYGFVPVVLAEEDTRRMHGVDERIPVAELGAGASRLVSILRAIDAK